MVLPQRTTQETAMNNETHPLSLDELDTVAGGLRTGTPGGPGPGVGPYAGPSGPITIQVPGTDKSVPLLPK
jgi:hypothetical protein